jgi:hypothetical protein
MRNEKRVIFLTAAQLEERAAARMWQAEQLPDGEARQHALKNAAQLRAYAAWKRKPLPEQSRDGGDLQEASDGGS